MSLLNKTKDNTIFLYTFIYLKNYVWTFHFFLNYYFKGTSQIINLVEKKERERKVVKTKERKRKK